MASSSGWAWNTTSVRGCVIAPTLKLERAAGEPGVLLVGQRVGQVVRAEQRQRRARQLVDLGRAREGLAVAGLRAVGDELGGLVVVGVGALDAVLVGDRAAHRED